MIFNCGFNLHFPEDYTLAAFKILSSVLTVQLCLVDLFEFILFGLVEHLGYAALNVLANLRSF